MKYTWNFILSVVAIFLTIYLMPGIETGGFWSAALLAIVLGIFNIVVKPSLQMLSIIPTLITILLFLLMINGTILVLADWLSDNITVNNTGTVVIFSVITCTINWILHKIFWKVDKAKKNK